MTNENIIKQLKRLIPSLQYADDVNAVKRAIKALSQEPKLTGICNECLKKNGCEMYSQLIKSSEKYTVESCEKYISKPCILDRRVDENTVVFKTIDGKEVEYIRKDTCEDAISRDAVCEIISDIRDCISVEGYWAIVERLKKLPSVTQKSETVTEFADRCRECGKMRKSHWILGINWKCDNCGFVDSGAHGFNYCPNCGANMESEDK